MKNKNFSDSYLKIKIQDVYVYIVAMDMHDLLKIGYVAERGVSEEKAAVQRIFNSKRVSEIKDYILVGGRFYSPFIINWNNTQYPLKELKTGNISFPLVTGSAQLIDGQHRFRGGQMALEENDKLKGFKVLVMITNDLSTKDASNIFININSKQQTVSKSLIYDLYKELDDNVESVINRATDLADALNNDDESPFKGSIIYPGKKSSSAKIQLSTVVDAIINHVGKNGTFVKNKLISLNTQKAFLINFSNAIARRYEEEGLWNNYNKNPFMSSAGFRALIDTLTDSALLEKVKESKSAKTDTFARILSLDNYKLLVKDDEYKKLGGKEQVKYLKDYLTSGMSKTIPEESEYEL